MGIDPINNISNNIKNTLCSYIILTLPLNKKGILQQHHSFSSWKHNTSLISSSCFNSQPSGWKQDTRLALRHNFSSWKHSTNLISSSCFTSQALGWKQDTRLGLRHNCQAGSTVLVSSHLFVLLQQ
jgi:hypothetical protein